MLDILEIKYSLLLDLTTFNEKSFNREGVAENKNLNTELLIY
jgi:hypothetical protein